MMFPGQPVLPPTPSADKPEAASESTKAPDAAAGAPTSTNLTSNGIKALINRGDLLLGSGDITSARLFYERAANAPDAQAALRLGESYDPAFLQRARLNRTAGSVSLAAQWYQRAGELGAPEADTLLRALAIASRFSH
jgi:TPR repeat protein